MNEEENDKQMLIPTSNGERRFVEYEEEKIKEQMLFLEQKLTFYKMSMEVEKGHYSHYYT